MIGQSGTPKFLEVTPDDVAAARRYFWVRAVLAFVGLCLSLSAAVQIGPFGTVRGTFFAGVILMLLMMCFYFASKALWAMLNFGFQNISSTWVKWPVQFFGLCAAASYAASGQGYLDFSVAGPLIAVFGGLFFASHLIAAVYGIVNRKMGAEVVTITKDPRWSK